MRSFNGLAWAWASVTTASARGIIASAALRRRMLKPPPGCHELDARGRGCQAARWCYDPGRRFAMAAIETAKNMRLLAQHELNGFGNVGEGMVIQLTRDGRRVLWLAHESAPKNLTALDVGDPRKPSVIFQSDLPHGDMRSNSLDLAGDLLVVAYQTKAVGMQPAGVEIFDVADPTRQVAGQVQRVRAH